VPLAISWSYYALPPWCYCFVWFCLHLFSLFHCFVLYEFFINIFALFVIHLINYLTTLFDVYCMCYLDRFVVCVLHLPNIYSI
jgi:hypothetical protein